MAMRPIQVINGETHLPNGDIWRGFTRQERPDNVEPVTAEERKTNDELTNAALAAAALTPKAA